MVVAITHERGSTHWRLQLKKKTQTHLNKTKTQTTTHKQKHKQETTTRRKTHFFFFSVFRRRQLVSVYLRAARHEVDDSRGVTNRQPGPTWTGVVDRGHGHCWFSRGACA
jgi:hypothetical protein